jgi:hypothetical protein
MDADKKLNKKDAARQSCNQKRIEDRGWRMEKLQGQKIFAKLCELER